MWLVVYLLLHDLTALVSCIGIFANLPISENIKWNVQNRLFFHLYLVFNILGVTLKSQCYKGPDHFQTAHDRLIGLLAEEALTRRNICPWEREEGAILFVHSHYNFSFILRMLSPRAFYFGCFHHIKNFDMYPCEFGQESSNIRGQGFQVGV